MELDPCSGVTPRWGGVAGAELGGAIRLGSARVFFVG